MKRFSINDAGQGTYALAADKTVALDMNAVFGFDKLPDLVKKAVAFSVGHVLRNATAGKMESIDDAFKAVQERAKALQDGKWTAHKESGDAGESRLSLLAQAVAQAMGIEDKDAAAFISNEIRTALEEKGIDPDADSDELTAEQKTARRKVSNAVRKAIADDPGVSIPLTAIKAKAANEKAAAAVKAAEGKVSAFIKPATPKT